MSRCPSGKIRYRDEITAKTKLAFMNRRSERRPAEERRVYACPQCDGWHLTSLLRSDPPFGPLPPLPESAYPPDATPLQPTEGAQP